MPQTLLSRLDAIAGQPILCVGDIMLDQFVYGDVERISPEAPIPVLSTKRKTQMPGGSGNVAYNLSGLGCVAYVAGVTGNDAERSELCQILAEKGIDHTCVITDPTRPTTKKTRYIVGPQQLLRVDEEKRHPITRDQEDELIVLIREKMPHVRAVILSDYGKGLLTDRLIRAVIDAAKVCDIPVLVDPKGSDFSRYRGAFCVTPNRKELAEATGGLSTATDDDVANAARMVMNQAGIGAVVATRSAEGMSVIEKSGISHLRAQAREVYDVSGAGDTVIATLAAAVAAGAGLPEAAAIANYAAGLVVEKVGTAIVYAHDLRRVIADSVRHDEPATTLAPILDWQGAREQVERWRANGYTVGFTNGCYDLLHQGHVIMLDKCRARCDRLIVAVNTDSSVRRLKGESRPVNNEMARAHVIASLSSVDMVVLFGENQSENDTPIALIKLLEPDVLMKGADYKENEVVGHDVVKAYGGRVALIPLEDGFSTTGTIKKISAA